MEHDFEAVDPILRDLGSATPADAPVLCLMVGMGQTSTAVLPADRGDLVLTTAESLHVLGRLEGFAVDDLFAANLLKAKLQERGTTLFTLSGDLSVFGMLRENQFRLISVLERQSGRAPGEAGFIGVGDDFGLALRLEAAAQPAATWSPTPTAPPTSWSGTRAMRTSRRAVASRLSSRRSRSFPARRRGSGGCWRRRASRCGGSAGGPGPTTWMRLGRAGSCSSGSRSCPGSSGWGRA